MSRLSASRICLHTTYVVDEADKEDAMAAAGATRSHDLLMRPYSLAVKVNEKLFYVTYRDGVKRVYRGNIPFVCVPSTADARRGLVTQAIGDHVEPFSDEAADLIENLTTGEPAELSGASMAQVEETDDPLDVAPVIVGKYRSADHPGDTSWQSQDGKTVISWWAGGRYMTSAQVWADLPPNPITNGMPTWEDIGSVVTVGEEIDVLDGVLPSATEFTGGLGRRAIDVYAPDVASESYVKYGVWKNGVRLYDSEMALAHMARKRTVGENESSSVGGRAVKLRPGIYDELVSLSFELVGSGGYGVRLFLQTRADVPATDNITGEKVTAIVRSRSAIHLEPLVAGQMSMPSPDDNGGSWLGFDWLPHTLVVREAPEVDDFGNVLPGQLYQCYAIFNPEGTKVLVYGVTSGPYYVDPSTLVNHTEADYRNGQCFTIDVPEVIPENTTAALSAVLITEGDAAPSWVTYTSANSSTSGSNGSPTWELQKNVYSTGDGLWHSWQLGPGDFAAYKHSSVDCVGTLYTPLSATSTFTSTWSSHTSELIPFVDWGDAGQLVAFRNDIQANGSSNGTLAVREYQKRKCYISLNGWISDGSGVSPDVSGTFSANFSLGTDDWDDYWRDQGWNPPPEPAGTLTIRDFDRYGNSTVSTSSLASSIPKRAVTKEECVAMIGEGCPSGILGPAGFYYYIKVFNKSILTFEGGPVANGYLAQGYSPGIHGEPVPFLNIDQMTGNPSGTAPTLPQCQFRGSEGVYMSGRTIYPTVNEFHETGTYKGHASYTHKLTFNGMESAATEFCSANTNNNHVLSNGTVTINNSSTYTGKPTWSNVVFADPRWPVVSVASERLWYTWGSNGDGPYYPGTKEDGALNTDSPRVFWLRDTLPSATPKYSYGGTVPNAGVGSLYIYRITSGAGVKQWLNTGITGYGDPRAARPPTGYERIHHYDISPAIDGDGQVLFGLEAYQKQTPWPDGWGQADPGEFAADPGERKPAIWRRDGDTIPIGISGLFGEGVAYRSPLFLAPYTYKRKK